MSQEYTYAVQRAELLGQVPPTQEEWASSQVKNEVEADEFDDAIAQDLAQADESAGRITGGLDELNSILSATQKKINRFKTVCGSLGTLLKVRVGSRSNTPDHVPFAQDNSTENNSELLKDETLTIETTDPVDDTGEFPSDSKIRSQKKIDLNQKMGSHLDKLDSLITKAENAQYSMQHQTKQMKKIISK